MTDILHNPAIAAREVALERMYACLKQGRSFRVEAGAGAGKTYSLVKAVQWLIDNHGTRLVRRSQQIACITYTNVAKDVIIERTQGHLAVRADTVHGFCWSLLQNFQATLRDIVPTLTNWKEKISDVGGIGLRRIHYELGYRGVSEEHVTLSHDDVIRLMVHALGLQKFRQVLTARYPYLMIDEYQDTNKELIDAIKASFLDRNEGPLIGLFGDHWQKIYGDGGGLVSHHALEEINKNANFRSTKTIVDVLNKMRPGLRQAVSDPQAPGEARVFHTNRWPGERQDGRGGGHWRGDVSPEAAHAYYQHVRTRLESEGWDFSPTTTKVLMLTHGILAREQGYPTIQRIFGQNSDQWLKKEDPHIRYLAEHLEPACAAFAERRYGEMFHYLGTGSPFIRRLEDKVAWSRFMSRLVDLRKSGTIGDVIDFIRSEGHLPLPGSVEEREQKLSAVDGRDDADVPRRITHLRQLRGVAYTELIALNAFINGHTPFATKHGVKGDEFENVLVVIGRGWNKYNFVETIERFDAPPDDRRERFEDNRNLLYVACSRAKVRLALLFTQLVSDKAMDQLLEWFGASNIIALPADPSFPPEG